MGATALLSMKKIHLRNALKLLIHLFGHLLVEYSISDSHA